MSTLLSYLKNLWDTEPLVVAGVVASVIVTVAGLFGVIIDPNTVTQIVLTAVPIIIAVVARPKTVPAAKVIKPKGKPKLAAK